MTKNKKAHKNAMKQKSDSDEDEVDNMVGCRTNVNEKGPLFDKNGSTDMDVVDGGPTNINKKMLRNAIGTRDENATSICENGEHDTDISQLYPFTWLNSVGTLISTILFIVDVVTDVLLAVEYNKHERILECVLTSSVVIASFLVAGTLSTIWYMQDSKGPKDPVKKTLFLVAAFPFATIIRNLSYFKHGCLSRKSSKEMRLAHYKQMLKEDRDASLLRMFDAFVESAPQLIIQIYLAIHDPPNETLHLEILRTFTIASSLVGLAWSVTSYYRVLRIYSSTSGVSANTICGGIGYFLWRLFEIGPRITAVVMLISVDSYGLYIIIGAIFHWMIMLTIAYFKNVKVYSRTLHNLLFIAFISYVQIISFMNLSRDKSRFLAIIYYAIFYTENAAMVGLFVFWTNMDKSSWVFITTVCVASSGTLFCSLFMVLYYKLCHPKVSRSNDKSEETTGFIDGSRNIEINVEQS